MTRRVSTLGVAALLAMVAGVCAQSAPVIDFPSPNRALLSNQPAKFYMYVNRTFEGKTTTPWEGGAFGFVRGPVREGSSVVFLTHHEGIDIAPVQRDPSGNPLDPIFAAADGTVVHTSDRASASNYGKYVVIEHLIQGSRYFTVYAHLARISVAVGDRVRQGAPIGVMGYTGAGLDRPRAHLHFEFALMVSPYFADWFPAQGAGDPNPHGNFNGRNLVGINPAKLLLAARSPSFDLAGHLRSEPETFRIVVPNTPDFTLVQRYPWLMQGEAPVASPGAWVIAFSRYGTPIRATPMAQAVTAPYVASVNAPSGTPYTRVTRGLVGGSAGRPVLTRSGIQLVRLLTERPAGGVVEPSAPE